MAYTNRSEMFMGVGLKMTKEVHDFIAWLEDVLETPIQIVSVGPDRKQTLFR